MKQKEYYLEFRRRYEPKPVKLVVIAESPPVSGKYFYDPEGRLSEPLFAAMMKQLNYCPQTKDDGLTEFKRRRWVLVDATYKQVDKHSNSERNKAMEQDYKELCGDLDRLMTNRSTPVILVKTNVCRLLMDKLVHDGYKVLNRGSIPFPSHSHQPKFHRLFSELTAEANSAG